MTPLDAALRYASWGWAVLPLQPGTKLPASAHGVKDASVDAKQIKSWFAGRDDLNLGIACGRASKLICFDVDPRNLGDASWGAWLAMHGAQDDGPHQLTAGGGSHYLADYSPDWRSCKLAQGVDLLSDGRYFVAWPSKIGLKSYEWEASSDPADGIAPFKIPPAWTAAQAAARKPERVGADAPGLRLLPVGSRNAGLASLAGAMRHHGMSAAEIMGALSVANELRCEPPLPSSEVSQIVDSICKYSAGTDTAGDAALGSAAADSLSLSKPPAADYYIEQASGWLAQPALPSWLIKHWLPDSGLIMIFGPSGAGKTFCALHMAASIATGQAWHGHKVAAGAVIYLAGEGHYGLRMRIAAWAQTHGAAGLENLYVSNRALDLDAPLATAEVIRAIREPAPSGIRLIVIDTLATHFAGDENSARDARSLIAAAQVLARAFECAILLIHHTGLGPADRARGSSSFKASMDYQLMLSASDGEITLACTKAKDSEPPAPLAAHLERVTIDGWIDEDGEPVHGAIFAIDGVADSAKKTTKARPLSKHAKNLILLEAAWRLGGCATAPDGAPVIHRQAMLDALLAVPYSPSSAAEMVKASGSLSAAMVAAHTIELGDKIWIVRDIGLAAVWAMQK